MKILFIAGFGPIVRDIAQSRKLYDEALGIYFREESGGCLHTERLEGAKTLHYGRCLRRHRRVLAGTPGHTQSPFRKHGLNSTSKTSRQP